MFPTLFDLRDAVTANAQSIASKKSQIVSKIPIGHIIAIDIDSEEILPYTGTELRDVVLRAMKEKPGARLALRRISRDGKVGPY